MPRKSDPPDEDKSWIALAVLCFLAPLGLRGCASQAGISFPIAILLVLAVIWFAAKATERDP